MIPKNCTPAQSTGWSYFADRGRNETGEQLTDDKGKPLFDHHTEQPLMMNETNLLATLTKSPSTVDLLYVRANEELSRKVKALQKAVQGGSFNEQANKVSLFLEDWLKRSSKQHMVPSAAVLFAMNEDSILNVL
jgi:hypothetical protein